MRLLFIVSLLISAKLYAQSFEPGLWKSKESVKIAGIPLPSTSDEECLTAAQTKDAKATIEKELNKKGCKLNSWVVKNKKLDASITCKNKDLDAVGKLGGIFTSKHYELKGEAEGTYKEMIPAVADISLSGQWVKKCPKK
ncbi:DUF3617 domain-containing protein [Pseudobdellovibrio sp. HCB154]|uniref:DUF3617 domain-containing protein n=1 Tax=Pseudobdellovibrio sp. HCB154 TaxID=3386277 RepID=UPI00391708A0